MTVTGRARVSRILLGRGSGGFAGDFCCQFPASFLAGASIQAPHLLHRLKNLSISGCAPLMRAIFARLEVIPGRRSIQFSLHRIRVMYLRMVALLPLYFYQPVDRAPLLYHAEESQS